MKYASEELRVEAELVMAAVQKYVEVLIDDLNYAGSEAINYIITELARILKNVIVVNFNVQDNNWFRFFAAKLIFESLSDKNALTELKKFLNEKSIYSVGEQYQMLGGHK